MALDPIPPSNANEVREDTSESVSSTSSSAPLQDSKKTDNMPADNMELPTLESRGLTSDYRRPSIRRRALSAGASRFPKSARLLNKSWLWITGPSPPVNLHNPSPWLDSTPPIQGHSLHPKLESKVLALTRLIHRRNVWLLVILGMAYIISLSFLVRANWYLVPTDAFTGCTDSFWSPGNGCGMNGENCSPFTSDTPYQFRCPAACDTVQLLNIRAVGDREVVYQPLMVGGGDDLQTYRGDSWVCLAAIQTGAISNDKGGCASVQLIGEFTSFIGTVAHGISSVSFNSTFPLGYRISPSTSFTSCTDLRSPALAFNIIITILLFVVLRPKPIVLFWAMVCIGYWHIIFFSDPAGTPPPISNAFGTFLPTLFIVYAFWLHAFSHVLPAFDAMPIERAIWYLVPFWCGTLINVITARLPLDRLTITDIRQQPGALVTILVIITVVGAIVLHQVVWVIRKTGWLPRYLMYYAIGGAVLLVLSQLPGLELRIHHYFYPILLIPGTAFPTRLSAVYQSLLLGIFLDGAARWGFASILQTAAELARDAPLRSSLPIFLTNATNPLANLDASIVWESISAANTTREGWNGFSLLVDDVERYSGVATNFSLVALNLVATVPHFFRLAYQNNGVSGDYTRAATFYPNGTFTDPLPGPS
ncbi:hypothetical protein FRB96_004360 [Tulasnella sp. 330]|nr:hypothetical protein FRB96_004360 [Tulasnella sp. 330]KAG8872257.1 hypothetical protein FRB98_009736 [Tulasnella sp. 332]